MLIRPPFNLNTSYVSVKLVFFKHINVRAIDLNTSYVSVKCKALSRNAYVRLFKYIICFG